MLVTQLPGRLTAAEAEGPAPPPAAAGTELDRLLDSLERNTKERRAIYLQKSEVGAIKAQLRRFDLSPEYIKGRGAPERLIEPGEAGRGSLALTVSPAYAEAMPVRVQGHASDGADDRRGYRLVIDYIGWGNVNPKFAVTLDPSRRRATLSDGQVLAGFPLRIALPTRPSIVIDWPDEEGTARIRIVDGYALYQLEVGPDGSVRSRPRDADGDLLGADGTQMDTVVSLLDGRLLHLPPGANPLAEAGLSEVDRIILGVFQQWRARLSGARDELQDRILRSMNRLDALNDRVAALATDASPSERRPLSELGAQLYEALTSDIAQFDLFAVETQARQLTATIEEIRLRSRLRDITQDQALEARGDYAALLDEIRAIAKPGSR
jgi:hypothetical protein